ncbi:hypothetical protein RDI58_017655 [Solanum bulbocastanum]|uniref:DUF4283 domain-containing protein n=1 Tax=Solanum bulbocastanum TaxID=147425 RepID=A0AAN8TF21_SOLBU
MVVAARKLTYSAGSSQTSTKKVKGNEDEEAHPQKSSLVDVVRGNKNYQKSLQGSFYPPLIKEGVKIVKLDPKEFEEQGVKWKSALIGYIMEGNPNFNDKLKFVYGVWNIVAAPRVYLHDDDYFIFKFESKSDKVTYSRMDLIDSKTDR